MLDLKDFHLKPDNKLEFEINDEANLKKKSCN